MAEYIDIDRAVTVKDVHGREISVSVRQILTQNFGKFEIADVVPVVRCKDCKHCQKMEMPKNCYECPIRQRKGLKIVCPILQEEFTIADVNIFSFRLKDCPLVPVPDHGRLIDADALIGQYGGNIFTAKTDYAEGLRDIIADVKVAPTIIPGEEKPNGE